MSFQQNISTYEDIDWHLLWANSRAEKSWKSKSAKDWNQKAVSFAERIKKTPYTDKFLALLDLDINYDTTVLDVGCGPGTLTIPLAATVKAITAIDYSEGMIAEIEKEAKNQNLNNIRTVICSWVDNWSDFQIGPHDTAIASRSMNIENLEEGLRKLDNYATKQVIITERIAPSPFDPDAFSAVGRKFNSGPDYIYTINTLYKMGIHPRIEHIELPMETTYENMEEAFNAYRWMLKNLSDLEEHLLADFLNKRIVRRDKKHVVIKRRFPQKWAVISWKK